MPAFPNFYVQMQNITSVTTVQNLAVSAEVHFAETIYVCYEENSAALCADAGNINHMFVTTDERQMREQVSESLQYTENGKYYPINEWEKELFFSEIGVEQTASIRVYFGCREDARESYGICVDCFDLLKSADCLAVIFS